MTLSVWQNDRTLRWLPRVAVLLLTALVVFPAHADWQDDVDFDRLQFILGGGVPNGAGVPISLVEAGGLNFIYFPDTEDNNFNAESDPLGVAVNFIDGSGGENNGSSNHANSQARTFFGNATSLAPAVNEVTVYEASDYLNDVLNLTTQKDPISQDFRVQNFSWVSSRGATLTTAHPDNVKALQRFDHVIDTNEVTAVVGLNNGTSAIPYLLGHSYNAIVAGVSDGDHSRGLTLSPSQNSYGPGRTKPSLVVPRTTTSAATSSISSAATLLHSASGVVGTEAANSETMRAILLAGATKGEFDDFVDPVTSQLDPWDHSPSQPLDRIFGAGELNVFNSWLITHGGKNVGSETPTSPVESHGWDYQTASPGPNVEYLFEVPAGKTAQELSIILTWNYEVNDTNPSSTVFTPVESMANLDLELVDSFGVTVEESISTLDNVEHIYLTDLGPGSYTLKVSSDSTRDFGIAWRMSTLFDTPSADFDEDGDVDGADFFTWQRGFGTLLGATHAMGDADGDGDVDGDDLLVFSSGFGPPIEVGGLSLAVPEPGTWALVAAGVFFFFLWRFPLRTRLPALRMR